MIVFSGFVLVLYVLQMLFGLGTKNANIMVTYSAALLAGCVLLIAIVLYYFTPHKLLSRSVHLSFLVTLALSAELIIDNGGLGSPLSVFLVILGLFSWAIGTWMFGAVLVVGVAITVFANPELRIDVATIGTFITIVMVPLLASLVLWSRQPAPKDEDKDERAYRELATELSQVASKSDVVINAIDDGVVALDRNGNIELINPAAQRLVGWAKQDAMGLNYTLVIKLIDAKDHEAAQAQNPIQQALDTNAQVTSDSFMMETSAGKTFAASVTVSPVGPSGAGVIIVFRDVTKARAEEREQAEFISTASHEMRTPVASIEGYLGLVLNPATATIDDKARDFITKAHASAKHLGNLFQDLLDISKADDGRIQYDPRPIDVSGALDEITQGLALKAQEKNLQLIYEPHAERNLKSSERRLSPIFYINVDPDHFREIVDNLIENAIKYTPSGNVSVNLVGDTEKIQISIVDTGIGIPKEDIPHLFQKFYRIDNSDTREIGGTGLGLYLCRKLTEQMGGTIWVESTYQKGSTFYIEFPRISNEEAARLKEELTTVTPQPLTPDSLIPSGKPTDISPPALPTNPVTPLQVSTVDFPTTSSAQAAAPAVVAPPIQTAPPHEPVFIPQPASIRPNTPLNSIENNPEQYLQPRNQ